MQFLYKYKDGERSLMPQKAFAELPSFFTSSMPAQESEHDANGNGELEASDKALRTFGCGISLVYTGALPDYQYLIFNKYSFIICF